MESILQQLPQLEAMCERLYNSQDPNERTQAEQTLKVFAASTDSIPHCVGILDNSSSPYAQLLASSSMLRLTTEHWQAVPRRQEMRSWLLSYLETKGPNLEPFVITSLVLLLSRVTKIGWMEDESYRSIIDDAGTFLDKGTREASQPHYLLGLRIIGGIVSEMNTPIPGRTLTQHRKTAVSFRDHCLYKAFGLSLTALRTLQSTTGVDSLREQAVLVALACLSFDFVGTCVDESAEDLGTIQIPSSWRSSIEDPSTLALFFEYYSSSTPPLSSNALECLVRLASTRRSLFSSEAERVGFLSRLVNGTRDILKNKQGLAHHENYHEFCRLLGRLKTNYQLNELVGLEAYSEWIQLVSQFTIESLASWQWASSSIYYLLGLWSRLVSSMPYLKGDSPSRLDAHVPQITRAYIESRLASAASGDDGELDKDEHLSDQLDALPNLCRFQYSDTAEFIIGLLDPRLSDYQQYANSGVTNSSNIEVLESQLTWLIHIVSAIIRGRMSNSGTDAHEAIDGDLAARVFAMSTVSDTGAHINRYNALSRQKLDLAMIDFNQNFRRVYIGEQVVQSSRVYAKLREKCGIANHLDVMSSMLAKIATNLKVYGGCEEVIDATLNLFSDLASGYMSGKLMLKLDAISYLLQHHTADYYPFLAHPGNMRARTTYYLTLARLLFMDDTPGAFKAFMAPIGQVLNGIASATGSNQASLKTSVPKETVSGLFRDLRGIAAATTNRRIYSQLFNWLYPTHFPAIIACVDAFADAPEVTTPLLKFMSELVHNKTQRLTFDSSSPNGILLFREVSKVLMTYGNRILSTSPPSTDPYSTRYKGIWICFQMLTRSLTGNYVNFGVFELYGDPALQEALDISLKLGLSIPLTEILAYRKVAKAWFSLTDALCHAHAPAIANRDSQTLAFILTSLEAGLKSLDLSVSSQCAAAIDNLAGYAYLHRPGAEEATQAGSAIADHLQKHPDLFPRILSTLFEIVLFEDCSNQWSLSRPMLPLILACESVYAQLRNQIVASQPTDRQPALSACLDRLMEGVTTSLDAKNRDKFTANLTLVRHEFRSKG